MAPLVSLGLARVTIATRTRRIDVALPDTATVGELLPHLVRHAGTVETGGPAGAEGSGPATAHSDATPGWALRRATGAAIDPSRSLTAQGVRDGEVLHLVARQADWPEPAYDDVVEMIASGARRHGRAWGGAATRRGGLVIGPAILALGLAELALTGLPRSLAATIAVVVAAVLALIGIALSRLFADPTAGGAVAGSGLPYAFAGGALALTPGEAIRLGPTELSAGWAALLLVSAVGYVGVAGVRWLFTAGIAVSLSGLSGTLLYLAGLSVAGSAAVTLTVAIGTLPAYPLIASWLGRLPVPELPDRPEAMAADRKLPERTSVFAAVARATHLLSGLLMAAALVGACATAVLVVDGGTAGLLLSLSGAVALLLRAHLFPLPGHRIPLLAGGLVGLALLVVGSTLRGATGPARPAVLIATVLTGVVVLAAGLAYSKRSPTPYLGRVADIADILAITALIPLVGLVTGAYQVIRALFAAIGD